MRSSSHKHAGGARRWRVVTALLALGLIPTFVPSLHSRTADAAPSKVLFRDDFNGTKLDASKWNPSWFGNGSSPTHPVNSLENDCYDPRQVSVSGGHLMLTAVPRACLGHAFASGLVNTHGKFQFVTGTFSARVWLPGGTGATIDWPGVWTDGEHWPNDGEIDLLEGLNGHDCWHVHTVKPTVGNCANAMGGGWHVVKLERTHTTLTFFYDGKRMGTESAGLFANSPHYLVLNLAVSKVISPPERPAYMLVDWVQVRT